MSQTLHKKVGKAVIIHPPSMQALILRLNAAERRARSTPEAEYDEWHIPGGSLEPEDEGSAEKAAVREALEETGLHVRVLGSLGVDGWHALYEGQPADFTAEFFACVTGADLPEPPAVITSGESAESTWVVETELQAYQSKGLTAQAARFIPLALQEVQRG